MEQEISLLDLLAAAIRKGTKIIIFAVIVGLLVMGYSYISANFAQDAEEEAYAMAEKERELRDLQKTVDRAQKGIDAEREYEQVLIVPAQFSNRLVGDREQGVHVVAVVCLAGVVICQVDSHSSSRSDAPVVASLFSLK